MASNVAKNARRRAAYRRREREAYEEANGVSIPQEVWDQRYEGGRRPNRRRLPLAGMPHWSEPHYSLAMKRFRKFGITHDDYEQMIKNQGGLCGICGKPPAPGSRGLVVDHCHETGEVRGLLCTHCNLLLGHAKDDPEVLRRAVRWLETGPDRSD